ncbi:cobalamin biosynthesis protein [Acetobacter sacchari]|uniref:Cobalamin biosynthesis protein n=1 Tax=Acetobacter sacchari TaxID=2661687 RepID=A0ABS3LVP0_9PROT|nr:cobalamin biosynthesis protein [Acetobacter sacchari]MBO1359985.1 cobalamin biosynthesis protein [Acetobacter sacchari]
MRVAGFGFRRAAELASLREALAAAGGAEGLAALATLVEKADAPAFLALAKELGLPVAAVSADAAARIVTLTRSERIMADFGTGSIAEAVALSAAGAGSRLLTPRAVSFDRMATAAIAEKTEATGP